MFVHPPLYPYTLPAFRAALGSPGLYPGYQPAAAGLRAVGAS
jgi:hypothetical protein